MFNKAIAIVLALQMAVVFSMPATSSDESIVTTVVGDGNQNMQALLDELTAGAGTAQGNNQVVKKTTTTTTTTTTNAQDNSLLSDDERLQNLMKDSKFAKQLRELLVQFLKMYNVMNVDSSKQVTTTTEKNVDVNSVLNNQPFMTFLSAFINAAQGPSTTSTSTTTDSSNTTPVSFLADLINHQKSINTGSSSSSTSSTNKVTNTGIPINGHSRPVSVDVDVNANRADSLITQLGKSSSSSSTSTTSTDRKKVNSATSMTTGNKNVNVATSFPSRFGGPTNVDVNEVLNHPSIASSESILDELKQQAHLSKNQGVNFHDNDAVDMNVHPGPSSSDWAHVHGPSPHDELSAEEFRQQAKNANYQFATQVNDGMAGNFQQRAEIRENGIVYGKYSYDDGFFWRTVYYEADMNGFRVTKQDVLPSHMTQHTGEASVQSMVNGHLVDYHITENDISHPSPVVQPHGLII